MNMLHDTKGYPAAELDFLIEGCEAVIKCRRDTEVDICLWLLQGQGYARK